MIIWGSKGRIRTIEQGQFMCPICRAIRPYELKQIGKYFTLYFVPLFKTSNEGEFVECQVCHMTYKPEILQASRKLEEEIHTREREQQKLLDEVKRQLDAGLSLQSIMVELRNAGVSENAYSNILYAATNGQIRECTNCGTMYKSTVGFCSTCGNRLPPPKSP